MTTYSIQAPDGKTYTIDGPEGASQQDVEQEVLKQHPDAAKATQAPTPLSRADISPVVGGMETALHEGSRAMAAIPAGAASTYELATSPAGSRVKNANDAAAGVQKAMTYEPRTGAGKAMSKGVDTLVGFIPNKIDEVSKAITDATGSAGLGATVDMTLQAIPILFGDDAAGLTSEAAEESAAAAARVTARAAHYVERNTGLKWSDISDSFKAMMISIAKDPQDLSLLDPAAVAREARAQSHAVPVPMTRGNATRDLSQITKEENLRRSPSGKPLMDTMAAQDQVLYVNLDVLRNEVAPTSKVQTTRDVGKSVQDALSSKLKSLQAAKNAAYEKARAAGEDAAPVDIGPLKEWLNTSANARNAPWLKSAINDYEQRMVATGRVGKTGSITINDLEEIRKEASAHKLGPPSIETHYAGEVTKLIDHVLDQAGGSVYQAARAANKALKDEFDRQGVIRKLTGTKGRSSDRAVALEDTLETTVIRGSTEDLVKVKTSLSGTPRGQQAWADLQAGAIDYLKQAAGGKRGIEGEKGQTQFNSSFLDAVGDLDRDGKLDVLFGARVAERVRSLAKTVHDVRTTPTGRISGSDSVPRIIAVLEAAKHIPIVGPLTRAVIGKAAQWYRAGKEANEVDAARRAPTATAAAKKTAKTKRDRNLRRYGAPAILGTVEAASGKPDLGEQQQ